MTYVQNLRIPAIFLISILLTGCGIFGTKIDVDATVTAVERAPLVLPKVDVVSLEKIKWRIVSIDINDDGTDGTVILSDGRQNRIEIKEALNALFAAGFDPVLYSITDEDYEAMALNQAKMLRIILQQQAVIQALKDYYMNEDVKDDGTDNGTDE